MSTLAILMLFSQNIPNISLFPSMAVDLANLATRDGTPFTRSIFDVYILLLDSCLNARNWSLRLNEKKSHTLIHYLYTYMYCIYVLSEHVATRLTETSMFSNTYIYSYIYRSYIYVLTYTFIHIRSYIWVHVLGREKKKYVINTCNKYVFFI